MVLMDFNDCTLYYWSACENFTGRATAIMHMLEHTCTKYQVKGTDDAPGIGKRFFAVPAVELKNGVVLSQAPAIHEAIGKFYGLYPTGGQAEEAQALMCALNAADIVSDSDKFKDKPERRAKWLSVMENTLASTPTTRYMVGAQLTYADFSCFYVLEAVLQDAAAAEYPLLTKWVAMMNELPRIKAFKKKQEEKGVVLYPKGS